MQLEKTDKTVEILEKTIKTISPFNDETKYIFDKSQNFIASIRNAFGEIKLIDFEGLDTELWNSYSTINQTYKLKNAINKRFEVLLNWQKDSTTIAHLNIIVIEHLNRFVERQKTVFQRYTSQEFTELQHYYTRISHRLFVAKLELNKLKEEIEKRETELQRKRHPVLSEVLDLEEIKLADNKKEEFNLLLQNMADHQFFVSRYHSSPVLKEDVLSLFGRFLNTQFEIVEAITPEESSGNIEVKLKDLKSFPEFILHEKREQIAMEIRKEFSNEKGKAIRLLLGAMELNTPPLLTIGKGKGKEIYTAMSAYFNRDIGSYQSVIGHIVNQKTNLEGVDIRLNHLLKKVENE
ncbi:MAG: hypothetical protein WCL70_02845 [Paludibacter sp.]